MATETELAWAAGFIDGEAAITLTYSPDWNYTGLVLRVTQSDQRPLARLVEMFGGQVRGHFSGVLARRSHFIWMLTGPKALAVMEAVRPYLRVKDKHADVALAFGRDCMQRTGLHWRSGGTALITAEERAKRAAYHAQMAALQTKGLARKGVRRADPRENSRGGSVS